MSSINIYRAGPLSLSICAPKLMSCDEIERQVNDKHLCAMPPSSLRWKIAADTHFKSGEKIPHQCEQNSERQHWFIDC